MPQNGNYGRTPVDPRTLLKVTPEDLMAMTPDGRGEVKGLMQIRQALYELLGAKPQENILPYEYAFSRTTAQGNAVPANATVNTSIKISADAAFIAMCVKAQSTGDFLIFPRIDASDRQLVNQAVNSATYCGTAERPYWLSKPLWLPANTTISFDVTDLSGAENQIYFTFGGYKVYL